MGTLVTKPTIDALPEKVLCMIFDRLNRDNVKNASLTCRRWHDIIFCSDYINRLQLCISFDWPWNDAARSREVMQKLNDSVKHTKRCYKKMRLVATETTTPVEDMQTIWRIIHPKVTNNLISLTLEITWFCSIPAMRVLSDWVKLMPKLQSLSVANDHEGVDNYMYTINSTTVKHMQSAGPYIFGFHMPQLESFSGEMCILGQLDEPAKLKRVELYSGPNESKDRSILHPLAHVETLTMFFSVEDWLLAAICDTCTELKHLYVAYRTGPLIRSTTLKRFSKLVNLRELVIRSISMQDMLPSDFDLGLSNLTKLELLDLGSDALEAPTLTRLPKSIRSLTVRINARNETKVIESITNTLPQLQKLRLMYPEQPRVQVAKRSMQSLQHLKRLEVLVFQNAKFGESLHLEIEAPLQKMRELLFVNCELDRNRLRGFRPIFPNLEELQFSSHLQIDYFTNQFKRDGNEQQYLY
uniref:F-box domain-containing protein n=1 Tax=Anopheles darlingi TaxID=43151 RepID=A0A2M4CQJ3_ANODA